jgi:hypothetical protein
MNSYLVAHSPSLKNTASLFALIIHILLNVCLTAGHGALIHWTWTSAQTGAYSIVQAVGVSHGLLGVDPSFPGTAHSLPGFLVVPHSPFIYARSSQTVPLANVHIPTCPPSDEVTILSFHHLSIQLVDAGFANPTVHVFVTVPVAYWLHFGSAGVSQYIRVHALGLPFSTVQLLHPSK